MVGICPEHTGKDPTPKALLRVAQGCNAKRATLG